MKTNKAASAEDFQLISGFQEIRKTLLDEKYADRLERPLAHWALPGDRRLPLAFLGRAVGDLLDTPFEELASTPGIGQKKMFSLVKLLERATNDDPPSRPFGADEAESAATAAADRQKLPSCERDGRTPFDPNIVSEALWEKWKETVRRQRMEDAKLALLSPSLEMMPSVVWHTPLREYMDSSVAEIRSRRTHGEKRTRVILEVFHVVHEILADAGRMSHVVVNLVPKFVPPIESWVDQKLREKELPGADEIRERLTVPLVDQIGVDCGETVHRLVEGRLGTRSASQSVRNQSRALGVTRARVYQLLDECSKVMTVRWPHGRRLLAVLAEKMEAEDAPKEDLKQLNATRELFYPGKFADDAESERA